MREKSELNHQESFLSPQVLSHLSLLRHSPTEVEGDTNTIDGGKSQAEESCEAGLSQSKCCFCQGVSGTSGFSCWVCGFSDHGVKI